MSGRYAIYFAPARHSPWWAFGAHWLGRDEAGGQPLPPSCPEGMDAAAFQALTAEPRRYGFHATLKAPFRLRDRDGAALLQQLTVMARQLRPVPIGILVPVYMDGFVALVPSARNPALDNLAALCVTELEALRAPLTPEELQRRRPETLDARGRELLERYGYPRVLERFRFHMTLTGPLDAAAAGRLIAQAAPAIARLNGQAPPVADRLCVFHEPAPGADFRRIHDVELGA